jgi:hypothetical protein
VSRRDALRHAFKQPIRGAPSQQRAGYRLGNSKGRAAPPGWPPVLT